MGWDDRYDLAVTVAVNAFIAAYLFVAWSWDLPRESPLKKLVSLLGVPVRWAGLWHDWSMFAPDPPRANRLLAAEVHLADGRVLRWEQPRFDRMSAWAALLAARERKFFNTTAERKAGFEFLWPALAEYLVRHALGQGHSPAKVVLKLLHRRIPPPGEAAAGEGAWVEQDVYVGTVSREGPLIPLRALADAWQSFFHAPEPASTAGVFRLLFGLLVAVNALLLLLSGDARRLLGPAGLLGAESFTRSYGRSRFTLLCLLPRTDGAVYAVVGLQVIAALCLSAGLFTRLSAAVVFVTLVSVHHRNPAACNAGDSLTRLLAFLLIFSQAGRAVSLDALLAGEPWAGNGLHSPWCLRLMQAQVAIVYLRTVYWKLRGRTWLNGTASYYPTQLLNYRRLEPPGWSLRTISLRVATWGTLALEAALGSLVWVREFRYPVLAAGAALHLLLEVFLNVHLFGLVMLVALTVFLDPHDVRRALSALGGMLET